MCANDIPTLFHEFLKAIVGYYTKVKTKNRDPVGASRYKAPNIDEQRPHGIFQLAITQCAIKIPSNNLAQMKDLKGLKQFQV